MNIFSGQTVLITGGSSGLGLEMARQLMLQKARVIICGRSTTKLEEAKKRLPGISLIQCDVSKKEERKRLADKIITEFPDLSILVNNAGIVKRFLVSEIPDLEEAVTEEWATNYLAPLMLSRLLLPLLLKNKGMIVNVSSGLAHCPIYAEPDYCATKAALHSITQSMRVDFENKGVRIAEILYPAVDTPFQKGHAPDFAITAERAIKWALKDLQAGKKEIHVGKAKMIYFMSRFFPKTILNVMTKAVPKNFQTLYVSE